jgi:hypothetical protein
MQQDGAKPADFAIHVMRHNRSVGQQVVAIREKECRQKSNIRPIRGTIFFNAGSGT